MGEIASVPGLVKGWDRLRMKLISRGNLSRDVTVMYETRTDSIADCGSKPGNFQCHRVDDVSQRFWGLAITAEIPRREDVLLRR